MTKVILNIFYNRPIRGYGMQFKALYSSFYNPTHKINAIKSYDFST